jgi:acyl carrier protein
MRRIFLLICLYLLNYFTAKATIRYVDSTATGSNNGSSWQNAYIYLSDALVVANAANTNDTILVAKGTYYPTGTQNAINRDSTFLIKRGGIKIYGGYPAGGGIRNISANNTILSGNINNAADSLDNSYHVLVISNIATNADSIIVDGLSIHEGLSNKGGYFQYNQIYLDGDFGGGIAINNVLNATKTVLKKINFKRNATRDAAGGLYVKGNSHILITQCKFEYNRSINGGAGIQIDLSNAVITNCLFVNNKCNIGIIENTGVCTPVIANSTFSHNVSQGAISIWANSTPTITNNIIYNHIGDKIFGNIPSTTQINNNIIEGGYSGNGIVGNILNQDPLFVNAPLDLQLQRCSPAIDYGVNANIPLGTSTDYIGNNRIFNNTVDIGAYELQNVQAIYNVAYVDSAYGNDNNTGNSWVSAFKTLSHALKAMQQLGCYQTADSILVAKGTYYPTGVQNGTNRDSTFLIKRGGIKLYGGFPSGGGTFAQRTLPITGDNTILSGDIGTSGSYDDNSYHVMVIVDINGIADSVVVDGFSITSSQANNNNLYVYASTSTALYKCNGGGIMIQNVNLQNKLHITNNKFYNNKGYFGAGFYNWNASPRVSNCIFTNNNAESDGGGFYNRTYSSPTIINCTYSNNTASNKGGAMENYDFSSPNIFNSTFNNNTATQSGGAIAISNQSSASIHNSLFSNNIASQDGGAINNNQSTLNAYNCTLKNNSALHGGALSDNNGATSNISHCTITNNSAIDNGGGMYNYNATSNVSYSVFSDNLMNGHLSGSGGAFCINATTTSDANFNNCVFNNNTATGIHTRSGAIQVIKGNVNVKNSTFFNNTTNSLSFPNTNAFDVIPPATANLYNTIIWNNSSQTIPYSGNLNYYNSLIQNATVVAPNINVNPKFINSDNPIGPDNIWGTADDGLQLSSCSPAVNIGNNINIPTNIIVDLIGNNRIFNSTVDLGAYESQVIPMPVTGTEVVTICQGQSYTFNGINYSSNNNTAKDTFVTAAGCDSIVMLNLTVAPALTHTVNPSICQGQSYSFGGTNYTTSQTGLQHTFVTAGGCDSIVTLNLMVSASITGTEVVTICQGQSYTFNGINYSSNNNTAKDTFVTAGGCDSIVTLNLIVAPALTHTINPSICQGQSYSFGGTNYTTTQTGIQHTFVTTGGCDSIVTLNLMVSASITGTEVVTICQGQSYTFNGINYSSNNNTAKDTFVTTGGCDSIVTLNLMVSASITGTEVVTICQGQSYTFNGINYSSNNNTAKDTFVTTGGCDSIVTLNLIVAPALTHTINPSICQGQSYSFGGTNYTTTQTGVQHTFVTTGGCDSIVTLNLTVAPALTHTINPSICQGQSYSFGGTSYTTSQTGVQHTFVTAGGCDSIVTLNLTVSPALTHTINPSICQGQSYSFGGTNYTTTQTGIQHTFVTTGGCDSIVTLNLTVAPALTHTVNPSICQGQSYSFGGTNYTTSQTGVQHTFVTTGGCDSIVTLNLMVSASITGTEVVTICQGQSYTFNGINYSSNNNTAKDTFVTAGGCDSIVTLNLIVAPALTHTINPSICQGQSYSFGGTNYTTTQTGIQHTFVTTGGCDSIVTLNLTVAPALTHTVNPSICQGQSYSFGGTNYTTSQTGVQHTFVTTGGCDSIVTLNLMVTPTTVPFITVSNTATNNTICSGTLVSFTANITHGGTNPIFIWHKNGNIVGNNSNNYSDNTLNNTDVISASLVSNALCRTTDTVHSATTTFIVNSIPNASASINNPSICSGTAATIALTSTVMNTTFTWTTNQVGATGASNGTGSSINQTLNNTNNINGTITYTITPTANNCTGTPISAVITVKPKPAVIPSPSTQSICSGTQTSIALSAAVNNTTFSWSVSNNNVTGSSIGTGNTIGQTLVATTSVAGTTTYTITPTANSCVGNNSTVIVTVTPIPSSPTILTGPITPCVGSTVTYTTPTIPGATSYIWTLPNGWTGTSTTNTINATLANSNGMVMVQSQNSCGVSVSTAMLNVNPLPVLTPNINIASDVLIPHCSGTLIHFTASSNNQGSNPLLQWRVNGNNVGSNNNTYAYVAADNDVVTCVLNSNYPCLTNNNVVSNALTMNVTPTVYPDMHIYVVENHLCSGMPVHFVGTPTEEGTAPIYQWKVNNINMGSTSTNFTYTPNDGDQVICELTSNAVCASPPYVLSNMVPMTVVVSTTPSINITDNRNGVYTNGEPITFTATVSGQGTNGHQISWFKNDIVIPGEIGTTLILLGGTQIKNNHVITARLLSLSPCATPDHAISNAIKVSNTTSIQDVNVPEHFKLYPNPTENTIYIEGLNPDDHIKVVDALGRTMQQHTVDKMGTFILDLNKEAQGMYWLQFYSKDYRSWQVKVNKL